MVIFILQTSLKPDVSEMCVPTARYKCRECGKPFSSVGGLRSHEDQHRGEYRYRCQYCHQGFPSTTNLRRHLTKHTGVREFVCLHCGMAFSSLGDLKRHSKSFKCIYYNGWVRIDMWNKRCVNSHISFRESALARQAECIALGSNQFETFVLVQLLFVLHQCISRLKSGYIEFAMARR